MHRNGFKVLGAVMLLTLATTQRAPAQAYIDGDGSILPDAFNILFPIQNPRGCGGGGPGVMAQNWLPRIDGDGNLLPNFAGDVTYNPAPGDAIGPAGVDWAQSPGDGFRYGTLLDEGFGIWYDSGFIEAQLGFRPENDAHCINFQDRYVNVVNAETGAGWPGDNVLGIAVTWVENVTGEAIAVDICTSADDSVQCWVNNKMVTNVSACRGGNAGCQETRPAVLPAGVSKITGLCWEGGGGHNMTIGIIVDGTRVGPDNGIVEFLGPNTDGDLEGQEQAQIVRAIPADVGNCPEGSKTVTLSVTGPDVGATDLTERITGDIGDIEVTSETAEVVLDFADVPTVLDGSGMEVVFVGNDAGGGSDDIDNGDGTRTSISTSGGDIWSGGDDFIYNYKEVEGDFDISIAQSDYTHENGAGRWGKMGLMARQMDDGVLDRCQRFTMNQFHGPHNDDVARTAGRRNHGECGGGMYELGHPGLAGGSPAGARPGYLRMTRRGNIFQSWYSSTEPEEPLSDDSWIAGHAENWGASAPESVAIGVANSEHNSDGALPHSFVYEFLSQGDPPPPPLLAVLVNWSAVSNDDLVAGVSYTVTAGSPSSLNLSAIHASGGAAGPGGLWLDPDAQCANRTIADGTCPAEKVITGSAEGGGGADDDVITLQETIISSAAPAPAGGPNDLANDACEDAISVAIPSVTAGSTTGATPDPNGCADGNNDNSPAVWYSIVGDGHTITVSTCGDSAYDTSVSAYSGGCGDLTCIVSNDDNCPSERVQSTVTVDSAEGEEILIRVHGWSGESGDYTLYVSTSAPHFVDLREISHDGVVGDKLGLGPGLTETGNGNWAYPAGQLLFGPIQQEGGNGHAPGHDRASADFLDDGDTNECNVMPVEGDLLNPDFDSMTHASGIQNPAVGTDGAGNGIWRYVPNTGGGGHCGVNYNEVGGGGDQIMHVAVFYLHLAEAAGVQFGTSSDDSVQLLVGSGDCGDVQEVGYVNAGRGWANCNQQDVWAPVFLGAGTHRVMMKVFEGGGGHGGQVFVRGADGGILGGASAGFDPDSPPDGDIPVIGSTITWEVSLADARDGVSYIVSDGDDDGGGASHGGTAAVTIGGATAGFIDGPSTTVGDTSTTVEAGACGVKNAANDWNRDGAADLSDAVSIFSHLFQGGDGFACGGLDAAGTIAVHDSNGDGGVDMSDGISLLQYLFSGGAEPQPIVLAAGDCVLMLDCADGVEDSCE